MRALVEKGRIQIHFEGDDESMIRQQEALLSIGSITFSEVELGRASCALSVQNFKKLRLAGCKLGDDDHTRAVVAKMAAGRGVYDEDTARAAKAKAGVVLVQNYSFKLPPFDHQKIGFQFLHSIREAALFGDCGTGKTFMVLTFGDSLLKAGEPWVFLVVCPVNLIKHVWIEDAGKFSDLTTLSLREKPTTVSAKDWRAGADKKDPGAKAAAMVAAKKRHGAKLKDRFGQDVDLYVINPENIRDAKKEKRVVDLCKRRRAAGMQVCLIIDESSKLKNRASATYKALTRIRAYCERCIIMTGTPSPNGVLDLWSQFSVLDGGKTLHPSFIDYRAEVAREITLRGLSYVGRGGKSIPVTKWEQRPGAAMDVYRKIEPRMIRFRTEDCIDLPPTRFIMRDVTMNAEQSSVYADMEDMLFAELEGQPITARVAATKLLKLREVTGGFVIADSGKEMPLGADSPKMVELDELLEQSIADKIGDDGPPSKALIWAQYQWECKTLVKRYEKLYGAKGLFGGISSGGKDAAIKAFKEDPACRILVCHPASAGHGLTLIEANYAFYYSMSYNFEEFYQSYRRMTRPGQKRHMTYYFLVVPDTIDEELVDAIRAKKNLSDLITDGKFSRDELIGKRGDRPTTMSVDWEVPLASDADPTRRAAPGEDPSDPA